MCLDKLHPTFLFQRIMEEARQPDIEDWLSERLFLLSLCPKMFKSNCLVFVNTILFTLVPKLKAHLVPIWKLSLNLKTNKVGDFE